MTLPFANQIDLHSNGPRIMYEPRHWDADGTERTARLNGATQCPKCGFWWPNAEEPDAWNENADTGKWDAYGWWGGVCCELCDLLMVEQPDGECEAYDLKGSNHV